MRVLDSDVPYLTECFKAAVWRCLHVLDERNGPLAMKLLVTRIVDSFHMFSSAAEFIAYVRGSGLSPDTALEAVDHPASDSGVDDLRLWLVRADGVWAVIGVDRGTVAQARASDPPEMDRLRRCLAELLNAPDLRFVREPPS